jgi:chorismate dehydratase
VRIGVVSFVNSKPYALGLEAVRREHNNAFTLDYAPPRELSRRLEAGDLDVALIPAYDFLRGVGAGYAPGHGIASAGEVDTVRLFYRSEARSQNGRVPRLERIRADRRSASSVALLRVLLHGYFEQFVAVEYDDVLEQKSLAEDEGLLVIGDAAHLLRHRYPSVDLGAVWTEWTGLPFVYALWVANDAGQVECVTPLLDGALAWAEAHPTEVMEASVAASGFEPEWLNQYQNHKLIYRLGPREEAGLVRFLEECRAHPDLPALRTITAGAAGK